MITEIEQSISQYFFDSRQRLENISTRNIANELYISTSAIVRFCQKLGYTGYGDFRNEYLEEICYLHAHFKEINPKSPFKETESEWHIANNTGHLYK